MTFVVSDNLIYGTPLALAVYFSYMASAFPIKVARGEKVAPGQVWLHLRAMVFPFIASISWYVMAAFSVVAGNSGTSTLYYYFFMLFLVYFVVGFAITFYLAYHPIVEVLQGREKLENG